MSFDDKMIARKLILDELASTEFREMLGCMGWGTLEAFMDTRSLFLACCEANGLDLPSDEIIQSALQKAREKFEYLKSKAHEKMLEYEVEQRIAKRCGSASCSV